MIKRGKSPFRKVALPTLEVHFPKDSESGHLAPVFHCAGSLPLTMGSVILWIADGDEQHALQIPLLRRRKAAKDVMVLTGSTDTSTGAPSFHCELRIEPVAKGECWADCALRVTNDWSQPLDVSVELMFLIPSHDVPRWLIPGMFYKDNGYEKTARVYPRFHPEISDPDRFVSNFWSFRADRCATPSVFGTVEGYSYFLSMDEQQPLGMGSVGFGYEKLPDGDAASALVVHYPWREVPVQYAPHNPDHLQGEIGYLELEPEESMEFRFRAGVVPDADNYGFSPVLRKLYEHHSRSEELNPWMTTEDAAELAAFGTFTWFYDKDRRVLYETCGFDKYFAQERKLPGYVDRQHMHVSWVSGIAYAHAMARWGDDNGRPEYATAGNDVIDFICTEGLAPCGAFWAQWTAENGWDGGWNPKPDWLHARTLGEACYFLEKALRYERTQGRKRLAWARALKSCLDFALSVQLEDGNFGTYYDANSGEMIETSGAAGLAWIPALVNAAELLKQKKYLTAAKRAGAYYEAFVKDAYFNGGCEDVHLSPCSEDGYNALRAYMSLYEATGEHGFLDDACRCAEWMLTFRWMYNTVFPEYTLLDQYDFHTRGGDVASPPNQHLHNYGLVAHEALLKLWLATGDQHYYDRARDHLHYSLQMIARADVDMNARRGMMSEQWYHTEWWQPKGCMLQLAHVWCAGFLIIAHYAHQEAIAAASGKSRKMLQEMLPQ